MRVTIDVEAPRRATLRCTCAALVALIALAAATPARADGVERAGALYDRAVQAQKAGDYARAASLFARADELVPNAAALQAALAAAVLADDAVLGMTLVERSQREPAGKGLADAARAAQDRFADRVGQLRVDCDPCVVRVDDGPFPPGVSRWIEAGPHRLVADLSGQTQRRSIDVAAGDHTVLTLARDTPGPGKPAASSHRKPAPDAASGKTLSPVWFGVGVGATAVAAALTIASEADTVSQHDAFVAHPTQAAADAGQSAETRTGALLGLTSALLLTTTLVGLYAVRWSDPAKTPAVAGAVVPLPAGAAAMLTGRF